MPRTAAEQKSHAFRRAFTNQPLCRPIISGVPASGTKSPVKASPTRCRFTCPRERTRFHDLLAGVAALRVTDMAVLQPRFVRDLLFAESHNQTTARLAPAADRSTPRNPSVRRRVSRSLQQNLPKRRKFFALDDELRAGNSPRRTPDNPAGNCADSAVLEESSPKRTDIYAGDFTHQRSGLRALPTPACRTVPSQSVSVTSSMMMNLSSTSTSRSRIIA